MFNFIKKLFCQDRDKMLNDNIINEEDLLTYNTLKDEESFIKEYYKFNENIDKAFLKKLYNYTNNNYIHINNFDIDVIINFNTDLKCLKIINNKYLEDLYHNKEAFRTLKYNFFTHILNKISNNNIKNILTHIFLDLDILIVNKSKEQKREIDLDLKLEGIYSFEKQLNNYKIIIKSKIQSDIHTYNSIIKDSSKKFSVIDKSSYEIINKIITRKEALNDINISLIKFVNLHKNIIIKNNLNCYLAHLLNIKSSYIPFIHIIHKTYDNEPISKYYKHLSKLILYLYNQSVKYNYYLLIHNLIFKLKKKLDTLKLNIKSSFKELTINITKENELYYNNSLKQLLFELIKIEIFVSEYTSKRFSEFIIEDRNIIYNLLNIVNLEVRDLQINYITKIIEDSYKNYEKEVSELNYCENTFMVISLLSK